jgi:hypothetical protein
LVDDQIIWNATAARLLMNASTCRRRALSAAFRSAANTVVLAVLASPWFITSV